MCSYWDKEKLVLVHRHHWRRDWRYVCFRLVCCWDAHVFLCWMEFLGFYMSMNLGVSVMEVSTAPGVWWKEKWGISSFWRETEIGRSGILPLSSYVCFTTWTLCCAIPRVIVPVWRSIYHYVQFWGKINVYLICRPADVWFRLVMLEYIHFRSPSVLRLLILCGYYIGGLPTVFL